MLEPVYIYTFQKLIILEKEKLGNRTSKWKLEFFDKVAMEKLCYMFDQTFLHHFDAKYRSATALVCSILVKFHIKKKQHNSVPAT